MVLLERRYGMNWRIPRSRWGAHLVASVLMASAVALGTAELAANAQDDQESSTITPPRVPANIQVPAGNKVFLVGHAVGTQNYKQVTTHYFSPNPFEGGTIRATWQHSRDTSTVWGQTIQSSSDPNFVAPGAIPWLLLQRVGAKDGPSGGDTLTATTFIQRLNTSGGVAPSTGCSSSTNVGNQAFVPYTADYFFYKRARR
jgi:hypothetical protein